MTDIEPLPGAENFEMFEAVSLARLNRWPIWAEYYDPEDHADIVSWGVPEETVEAELEYFNLGVCHPVYPVLRLWPIDWNKRLYVAAWFTTPHGHRVRGCLVDDGSYSVRVFIGGDALLLNLNLPAYLEEVLATIRRAVNDGRDPVLPLRWETDALDPEGRPLRGVFEN